MRFFPGTTQKLAKWKPYNSQQKARLISYFVFKTLWPISLGRELFSIVSLLGVKELLKHITC